MNLVALLLALFITPVISDRDPLYLFAVTVLGVATVATLPITPGFVFGCAQGSRRRAWRCAVGGVLGMVAGGLLIAFVGTATRSAEMLVMPALGAGYGIGVAYADMDDWLWERRKAHSSP